MKEWFKARNIWGAAILSLSDAEAGRLAKALWSYTMTGEEPNLSGAEKGAFAMIQMTLSLDEARDADISEKRSRATESIRKQKISNDIKTDQLISNDIKIANKNKNKNKEKEQEKELKEREFALFWSAYPRKEAKPKAKEAFMKINPDEELLNKILTAIEKWKSSSQWQEDGGKYIPHPTTWLNQQRWNDEPRGGKDASGVKQVVAQQYEQRDYSGQSRNPDDILEMLEAM